MSATGLEVFDKTLHTTHLWLGDIMHDLGPDRQTAWKVLGVVLRQLRDRLPANLAAHLGAQLPLLVRGAYYDQYRPSLQPDDCDLEEFCAEVGDWLSDTRPVDPVEAVRSVFRVLSLNLPEGQVAKVTEALPEDLRGFWARAALANGAEPSRRADGWSESLRP